MSSDVMGSRAHAARQVAPQLCTRERYKNPRGGNSSRSPPKWIPNPSRVIIVVLLRICVELETRLERL